jgi:hypothetical protein
MCMKGATSPVDGSYLDRCDTQRGVHGRFGNAVTCGPDGDWFEPRAKASAGVP